LNILCIGDVVGKAGRAVLASHLGQLIEQRQVDLVVCNAENAAGGSGLTPQIFAKLLKYGVDVVTLGDHVYRRMEIVPTMETSAQIVRPANLPASAAGKRWTVVQTKSGSCSVGVACALGQMYMRSSDSPWTAVDRVWSEMPDDVKVRVLDFHAEASSEKIAMCHHLDGRASIIFGTHTHIPTADARVSAAGTACISDVGMTGPYDSVLGRRKDRVVQSLVTSMPVNFEVATGDPRMCGVLATVNSHTGRATSIERIEIKGQEQTGSPYDEHDRRPQRH